MKRLFALVALVLAGCVVRVPPPAVPPPPPPVPVVTVSVDRFDPYLDPYGAWMIVPGYGRVWQPAVQYVGLDFYPYGTGGQWVYTDAGWVFDNDYPFGWAVFHYGRWFRHLDHGWLWVPGNTWASAWVSWRTGGVYVGWAPLGPHGEPAFHHHHWCFVERGHFRGRDVRGHAVGEQNFHAAVAVTRPVHDAVPVGPPPTWVAAGSRVPIVPVPVNDVRSSGRVVPPPPPPGRVTASVPPPPPPTAAPPPPMRAEPERTATPPPPARFAPERTATPAPPPARFEPPPPARVEPERTVTPAPPPPARFEPAPPAKRYEPPPPARFERTPAPPPARVEPERLRMPPPAIAPRAPVPAAPGVAPAPPPPPAKKKVVVPAPPPGRQKIVVPPPPPAP